MPGEDRLIGQAQEAVVDNNLLEHNVNRPVELQIMDFEDEEQMQDDHDDLLDEPEEQPGLRWEDAGQAPANHAAEMWARLAAQDPNPPRAMAGVDPFQPIRFNVNPFEEPIRQVPNAQPAGQEFNAAQELDRQINQLRQQQRARRPRQRGAARVEDDNGRHLPYNINPPQKPQAARPQLRNNNNVKQVIVEAPKYIDGGHVHRGYTFSRKLHSKEDTWLRTFGYASVLDQYPDLKYVEIEQPLNEEEECIIVLSELADALATEECTRTISGFCIKTHNKEYQTVYKKHIKTISSFKRIKNG
jgi:hypothetical protein